MFPFPFSFVAPQATGFENVNSFSFDGIDEYVTTGLNLAYTVYPNITASFWIKIDPSDITPFLAYYPIGVEAGVFVNGSLGRLYAEFSNVKVAIQGPTGPTFSTTNLADNNWHNIIITYEYDAAGTIANVYVDGSQEITNKLLFSFAPLTGSLFLGSRNGSAQFYVGNLDEVAVWNSILSSGNIATIYGSGVPSDLSSLSPIGWWRMGEEATFSNPGGTGNWTLTDEGSGSNNATSANMEESDKTTDVPT